MRPPLPDNIKHEVIRQWLNRLSRDNIRTGTKTKIINEWTRALGNPEAYELRKINEKCWPFLSSGVGFRQKSSDILSKVRNDLSKINFTS